jgi:hypothetical protein
MTAYVIIHATVDDTETHHREIVPKIMRAVERHGGKRIALGRRRAAQGPPRRSPGRSRVSQPRGRRGLGRGCQGQSRAAPHISVPAI